MFEILYPPSHCILPQSDQNGFGALYLGDIFSAKDIVFLKNKNVSVVLSVAEDSGLNYEKTHIKIHEIIPAFDTPKFSLLDHFEKGFDFIEENRKNNNILVHCFAGVSRSASIVIAYLMKKNDWGFEKSWIFVKEIRGCVWPNPGFQKQLLEYEKLLMSFNKEN